MSNYFEAKLKSDTSIEVSIPKAYNSNGCQSFYLYDYDQYICELSIISKNDTPRHIIYQLDNLPKLELGRRYVIYDEKNTPIDLDCSSLLIQDKYVSKLGSDKQMGAIYSKTQTIFRLFSPLASSGIISCVDPSGTKRVTGAFIKDEATGVLEATIKGDLANYSYLYILQINNEPVECTDPYAESVTLLSEKAVIINPKDVQIDLHNDKLKPMGSINDAIIYETSVRDLTSYKWTNIVHKAKFLGLTEKGIKTAKGNPVGIDYLESLGVTHVQLLPIYDFQTTNDLHPEDTYNWGYDPLFYNSPEGSFSTNPSDPKSRIIELKKMIGALHERNIRVVMDVVYNHVFCRETSPFEKCCPNYYFRFNEDGTKSNGSFCGNDFESRKPMGRKFIVDSCLHWVKEYGIDGFRFDLMGIIDRDTILEVYAKCKQINKDFIIYGEGWDMPTAMPSNLRTSMNNAMTLENIGFFNDRFRDITKGSTSLDSLYMRGYLTGDTNYVDGFKHCFLGSIIPIAFPPLFKKNSQSINYVECHDNSTLYDKIKKCCYDEDESSWLRRIKMINAAVVLAYGVPFIHMGQEIGLSKNGDHNSYNSGDLVNQFNYGVLDERQDMYRYFIDVIKLKKKYPFLRLQDENLIKEHVKLKTLNNGTLMIKYTEICHPFKEFIIYMNPTKFSLEIDFDDYYQIIFNESGLLTSELYSQHLIVNPLSLIVVVKK